MDAVLHVIASTDRRGAETAALRVSGELADRGWLSDLVALAHGDYGGLDLPVLGARPLAPRTIAQLRKRAAQASVIVAHGSTTLPAVAMATTGLKVPFVYRSIGDPLAWVTSPARQARVRAAVSRARMVVAIWRGAAVSWHEKFGVPAARLTVIPNGIRVSEFQTVNEAARRSARIELDLDPGSPVVLCLGALSSEKRFDLAVEAVGALDDVQLLIAGDGPERDRLETMATALGGRARFTGRVDDPKSVLAAADVLLLPSSTEGQPAVAIEAALSGVPVVATRVGGLGEIVIDGATGILVPLGHPTALASAVRSVIADRSRFGDAGRSYCSARFNLESLIEEWVFLLRQVQGYPDDGQVPLENGA